MADEEGAKEGDKKIVHIYPLVKVGLSLKPTLKYSNFISFIHIALGYEGGNASRGRRVGRRHVREILFQL